MATAKFCKLQVVSRMSRQLTWHQHSAPPVSMLLLQQLLSATSLFQDVKTSHVTSAFCSPLLQHLLSATITPVIISSSSLPLRIIYIQLPLKIMNHAYIVSYFSKSYIMHNTTIAYIVSYYSKSCMIILLLPLFRQNLTKVECMNLKCKYYRPIVINCSKGHAPIASKRQK